MIFVEGRVAEGYGEEYLEKGFEQREVKEYMREHAKISYSRMRI